ncbi:MAG TPA: orotidine-5'-phosphate decarboxylase [Acidimicrobiia bacterium]|nr:orotidine-5'-phosphate decarboxylase [Acidimicrobiia bacterium]
MNPIIVALDVASADMAVSMATRLAPHVGGFKVGLELLMGEGPDVIRAVGALGAPVFADAKLHDIPNTVGNAARQLGRAGARWVTVHGAGGLAMIEAAVEGLSEGSGGEAGVLVVTVLTSLDEDGLRETGVGHGLASQVATLAKLAARAGAEGVVSSILEVGIVKEAAPSLKVVTPGIRAPDADRDDQRRIGTLTEALDAGADLVVVGRAITGAPDVVAAARGLADEAGF